MAMRKFIAVWAIVLGGAVVVSIPAFAANAVQVDVDGDGKEEIVLENRSLRVVIAPHFGGQALSVFRKDVGAECVPDGGKGGGFFSDHDLRQGWPGEFYSAPYEATITSAGPEEAAVLLRRVAEGKWQQQETPSLQGLRIEREVALLGDRPLIRLRIRIVNDTDSGKLIHYWLQNIASAAGDCGRDRFFRPGTEALDPQKGHDADWLYTPTGGWTARCDPARHAAIVWLMDYNYLKTLYNCMPRTTEWMYDPMPVPAGSAWETKVWTVFCTGLDAVAHASESIVTDSRIAVEGTDVRILHRIASGPLYPSSVRLSGQIANRGTGEGLIYQFSTTLAKMVPVEDKTRWEEVDLPAVELKGLGFSAKRAEQRLSRDPGEGLLVADIRVEAAGKAESFQISAVSGHSSIPFTRTPPARKKTYLKPKEIALRKDDVLDALLVVEPAVAHRWRLEEVVKKLDPKAKITVAPLSFAVWKGQAEIENLPTSYDEMLSYDVVILQAGDMQALGDFVREMLGDYLKAGGGLITLGGYFSYGKGRYPKDWLTGVIPVECTGPFDLRKAAFDVVHKLRDHPALARSNWRDAPRVPFYHRVAARPGHQPLLVVDGSPLLVVSDLPAGGRIASFTGTVLGRPQEGTALWEWEDYLDFMGGLVRWAAGAEKEKTPPTDARPEGRNLLKNPGFEEGLKHWTRQGGTYEPRISFTEEAHGGSCSVLLAPAMAVRPAPSHSVSGAIYQGVPFDPGKKYRFSVWAKGVGRFQFYVYQYDRATFAGSAASPRFRLTPRWQNYAFEYVAGSTEIVRITIAIHVDEGSAAYIDDVEACTVSS